MPTLGSRIGMPLNRTACWFAVGLAFSPLLRQAPASPQQTIFTSVSAPDSVLSHPALTGSALVAWGRAQEGQTTVPAGLSSVRQISGGGQHSLALKSDGTVTAWGDNSFLQADVPAGLTGVSQISAGRFHSLALKSDGTVAGWGRNSEGQINIPAGLTGVVQVAAGGMHSLALKADGTVVAWGGNAHGQTSVPAGLSGVVQVAAGEERSLALRSNGTVAAWGGNILYGDPAVPAGLSGVVRIASGNYHGLALKADGTVAVWGSNGAGQLAVPAGLSGVVQIAAGGGHNLILRNDGSVTGWGSNTDSQLILPPGLSGVTELAAGGEHSLALTAPVDLAITTTHAVSVLPGQTNLIYVLRVSNRGSTRAGVVSVTDTPPATITLTGMSGPGWTCVLGAATCTRSDSLPPGASYPAITVTAVVAAAPGTTISNFAAVNVTGDANPANDTATDQATVLSPAPPVAWGLNQNSVPPPGSTAQPLDLTGVVEVAAGSSHTIALKADGSIAGWGWNLHGQSNAPSGLGVAGRIAAGANHNVILRTDGTVGAWGLNNYGQTDVPAGLGAVIQVAAGSNHSLALRSDGAVVAWGNNSQGQCTPPVGLSNVVQVAAGEHHSLALKEDGSVVAWGRNGTAGVPAGLRGVVHIAAGYGLNMAVKTDGTLTVWEANGNLVPPPAGATGIIRVSAGDGHGLALRSDGTIFTWGSNQFGQTDVPAGMAPAVQIASGGGHSVAVTTGVALPASGPVGPADASGTAQVFAASVSDPNGRADVRSVYFLINSTLNGAGACFVRYEHGSGMFYLLNDSSTAWSAGVGQGSSGSASNSQCTVDGAASGLANKTALGTGVLFALVFSDQFGGAKKIFAQVIDSGGLTSGWQEKGTFTVMARTPPVPVSVGPANGSGSSQVFTATVSDLNGASDIRSVYLLINSNLNGAGACFVRYESLANAFMLLNDTSTGWSEALPPGGGSAANTQCTFSAAAAAAVPSGNSLTVAFPIGFAAAFAGAKSVYLMAIDATGKSSNWQPMTGFTVTFGQLNVAPTAVSVTPPGGSGLSQTFSVTVADVNGHGDIRSVYFLLNSALSGVNGCFVRYERTANEFSLLNDTSSAWSAAVSPGAGSSVSNSQCTLSGEGGGATASGNSLTVTIPLSFPTTFAGPKDLYLMAIDSGNLNSGWQSRGTFAVTAFPPQPVSVTPAGANGLQQDFVLRLSDADGAAHIRSVYLLINSGLNGVNGCFVRYEKSGQQFFLLNDASTAWSAPVTAGSAATLSNSQCTFSGASATVQASGSVIDLNIPLTFNPSFAGDKTVYVRGYDSAGADSSWQAMTTFTVGSATQSPPTLMPVSPANGTGTANTFTTTVSDVNGASDITAVYMLVNSSLNGVNGCFVRYDRLQNRFYLLNDSSDMWLAPLSPLTVGSVSNSQCTLAGNTAQATGFGANLTVVIPLTFHVTFSGPKTVYLWASDALSNTGWQARGLWTVTAAPQAPESVRVEPSAGSGASGQITGRWRDSNGAGDLATVYLLINSGLNGVNACFIEYNRTANTIRLINDASNAWSPPLTPGTAGSVSNSQCTVNSDAASVALSADEMAVTAQFTFKPAFSGPKSAYLLAFDAAGNTSGWQQRGAWTVP